MTAKEAQAAVTAADIRARWGLPDWKIAGEYPAPGVSMRKWGWEFLRRRADYRAAWLECAHRAELTPDGRLLLATVGSYEEVETTRRQYGTSLVIDPRAQLSEWDLSQFLAFRPFGYGVGYREESIARAEQRAGKETRVFDLSLPLAPQLEAVGVILKRIQDERGGVRASPKNRVENWPRYLRVLDAHECGAEPAVIRKTLWPGLNKDAGSKRDLLKAAQAAQRRAPFFV